MSRPTGVFHDFLKSNPAHERAVDGDSAAFGSLQNNAAKPAARLLCRQRGQALLALAGILWLLAAFGTTATRSNAQIWAPKTRVVQGRVLNPEGKPQQNAVVYLKNQKTLEIKTYISAEDGSYRFGELASDVDYQVWAQYQKSKSKTRSISSFDSKKQFTFELKLGPAK